jgi:hypothetical protein
MFFITLLILTTLSIAGSAAFFSIYGLAQIFAGSFWPVVLMASSLEAGKLISASYLYRYWKRIGFLMKTYLLTAIFILMLITSAGIFGFLSSAYQEDMLPLEEMQSQIVLLDDRKVEIERMRQEDISRRSELNQQVSDLPKNYATKREIVRKQIKPELDQIVANLQRYALQINNATELQHELKTKVLQQKVHTGPIIFIAEAFGHKVDDATKWMILLIIFAFDPLAVILTVGVNIAIVVRADEKALMVITVDERPKGHGEKVEEPIVVEVKEKPPVVVNNAMTVDELEEMLNTINTKHGNSPEVQLQKMLVEEMLAKKRVTERVRNPHSGSPHGET